MRPETFSGFNFKGSIPINIFHSEVTRDHARCAVGFPKLVTKILAAFRIQSSIPIVSTYDGRDGNGKVSQRLLHSRRKYFISLKFNYELQLVKWVSTALPHSWQSTAHRTSSYVMAFAPSYLPSLNNAILTAFLPDWHRSELALNIWVPYPSESYSH